MHQRQEVTHAPASRVYADRVARRHRHNRHTGGHSVPRVRAGAGESAADDMPLQSEADGPRHADVRAGLRRSVPAAPAGTRLLLPEGVYLEGRDLSVSEE